MRFNCSIVYRENRCPPDPLYILNTSSICFKFELSIVGLPCLYNFVNVYMNSRNRNDSAYTKLSD